MRQYQLVGSNTHGLVVIILCDDSQNRKKTNVTDLWNLKTDALEPPEKEKRTHKTRKTKIIAPKRETQGDKPAGEAGPNHYHHSRTGGNQGLLKREGGTQDSVVTHVKKKTT